MYYCIIKDGKLEIVTKDYYDEHRKELIAIAVGSIDEVIEFIKDVIIEGDDDNELE